MAEELVNDIVGRFSGTAPEEVIVFIISLLPILELRGGLIAASLLDVNIVKAVIICVIGNIIPIPFILLFITRIFEWLKKFKYSRKLVEYLEKKSMGKSEKIQKYQFWGLVLFVGIPLPGTGAWTGSLIAALLGIDIKKSTSAIFCGIVLAMVIMTMVSYGIPYIIEHI